MKLLEFQAKKLLSQNGVRIPEGFLMESTEACERLRFPAVVKAQIPIGGRGKLGAVRRVKDKAEALAVAGDLIGTTKKGYTINSLLVEEAVDVKKEMYISCLNDREKNRPMFMTCAFGGIEIENLAQEKPEQIGRLGIDPFIGIMPYDIRRIASELELSDDKAFAPIVKGLWHIVRSHDATLVEINPLAVTDKGLVALDAKIILDDNARFRHDLEFREFELNQENHIRKNQTEPEVLAQKYDIAYVGLEGDIGIIADGAGTGMLTLDMVRDMGGKPANFCEMGGKAAADAAEQAMEIVLANPKVKTLLISLIGGMTRMDQVAQGIDRYLRENECRVPLFVRMCGTKTPEGSLILAQHGIQTQEDLQKTVQLAVENIGT